MTRIVTRFVFHIMYTVFYVLPIMILVFIGKTSDLHFDLGSWIEGLGVFKFIIVIPIAAYIFVLPGYRAKLASDAYGDRDIGFWEAHVASGTILRTHLSFLPIVGQFFEEKTARDD